MDNKFSLRPLTENDAESFARQLNNKKVWDNLRDGLPYPYTIEDAKIFIESQHNEPSLTCYGIQMYLHQRGIQKRAVCGYALL